MLLYISNAGGKSGNPRHIQCPGLSRVRQKIRHFLLQGHTARSPLQQRLRFSATQQQTRSLGAQQSLVTGHGDKIRPQLFHIHRQHPGRLRCIDHKRNPLLPAQSRHLFHRQNIAEDIGHVGEYRRVCPTLQRILKAAQSILPAEEFSSRHLQVYPQRMQRTRHRIMLKSADQHFIPRLYQRVYGHI